MISESIVFFLKKNIYISIFFISWKHTLVFASWSPMGHLQVVAELYVQTEYLCIISQNRKKVSKENTWKVRKKPGQMMMAAKRLSSPSYIPAAHTQQFAVVLQITRVGKALGTIILHSLYIYVYYTL